MTEQSLPSPVADLEIFFLILVAKFDVAGETGMAIGIRIAD